MARKRYRIVAFNSGTVQRVCELKRWTEPCLTCSAPTSKERGPGCYHCGFTGKQRTEVWVPLPPDQPKPTGYIEGESLLMDLLDATSKVSKALEKLTPAQKKRVLGFVGECVAEEEATAVAEKATSSAADASS